MANEPMKRPDSSTIVQQYMPKLLQALGGTPDVRNRFQQAAVSLSKSPGILRCSPNSVLDCVYKCARLRLIPDPVLQLAAVVPFRNNKSGTTDATLIIQYRGMIQLAKRANPRCTIKAGTVYANDEYTYEEGLVDVLKITRRAAIHGEPSGEPILFYAVAREPDAEPVLIVIPAVEARSIGQRSKAGMRPGTPWHDHFAAMGEKTAVKRLMRFLQMNPDEESQRLMQAIQIDDASDSGDPDDNVVSDITSHEGETHEPPVDDLPAGNFRAGGRPKQTAKRQTTKTQPETIEEPSQDQSDTSDGDTSDNNVVDDFPDAGQGAEPEAQQPKDNTNIFMSAKIVATTKEKLTDAGIPVNDETVAKMIDTYTKGGWSDGIATEPQLASAYMKIKNLSPQQVQDIAG